MLLKMKHMKIYVTTVVSKILPLIVQLRNEKQIFKALQHSLIKYKMN